MPSASNILTLTALLALTALPSTVAVDQNSSNPRRNTRKQINRKLRRQQINHIHAANKPQDGAGDEVLEEDVAFWTNMARRTQESMSISTPVRSPTPVPTTVDPIVTPFPTEPPAATPVTPSPIAAPVATPVPTGGTTGVLPVVCIQGSPCQVEGAICSDGTTEECCGEVFDSFTCTCSDVNGELLQMCGFTDACLNPVCETDPPVPTAPNGTPPPTQAPLPAPVGFICPVASVVGCTAPDPSNPENECPVVGEPCPDGNAGEFCCLDDCPRRYCTAKQAPTQFEMDMAAVSSKSSIVTLLDLPDAGEYAGALDGTVDNGGRR